MRIYFGQELGKYVFRFGGVLSSTLRPREKRVPSRRRMSRPYHGGTTLPGAMRAETRELCEKEKSFCKEKFCLESLRGSEVQNRVSSSAVLRTSVICCCYACATEYDVGLPARYGQQLLSPVCVTRSDPTVYKVLSERRLRDNAHIHGKFQFQQIKVCIHTAVIE